MSRRERTGFSLIELMIVLLIISTLLGIGLPAYANLRRHAIAVQAAADLRAIRAAAVAEYDVTGQIAPPGVAGVVPAGMAPYLPHGFTFSRLDYQLTWMGDVPVFPSSNGVVAVQVPDPTLLAEIDREVGATCWHTTVGSVGVYDVLQTTLEP
ncbi:MAG TPA: prepilin-type N-terminal cleavage/methylation domain-containing protein [Candidatus Acidoferrales bacterium]|nr:prepilin-type N-terminal cleavage/methylation domain-containing protein [Candidatus Acidoferrales bacterium]